MHSGKVLAEILERAKVSAPDSSRPLWRYPATAADVSKLKREFEAHGEVPRRLSRTQEGALALLVAHLLCERLGAGAWKWDPVFEELGWRRGQMEEQRLREHLGAGLELYWRRKVRVVAGDREVLGTLLLEGGLPLAWLKGNGVGGVQYFLQRLIRLVERYAVQAAELADDHIDLLPDTLREDSTVQQLTDMADVLVDLRRKLPSGCESPADFLSVAERGWRQRLPLPQARLEQADEIVAQLLATESGVEQGPPILALDWRLTGDTERLERHVALPDRMTTAALAHEVGTKEDALPSLMYLSLESSRGRRLQLARLERRGDANMYVVVPSGPASRLGGLDEWRAVIAAHGKELGSFMPVGGDALETELPWVFDDRPGTNHVLLAAGSCESRHQTFLVSLPSDAASPIAEGPESSVAPAPELTDEHRTCYRIVGSAQATVGDEVFNITGGGNASTIAIKLRAHGPRLWLGTPGTTPFLGAPRVSAHDGERPLPVPVEQLEWRSADGSGRWRQWSQESPTGEVTVRWRRESVTVARIRTTVLPSDFRITTAGKGLGAAVEISAHTLQSLKPADGFPATVERDHEGTFRICSTEERPQDAELRARLRFAHGTLADVRLPIPSPATGFVCPTGGWLPPNAKLSFARTDALRARGAGHKEFQLDVRIPAESSWELLASAAADSSGWVELSLDAVRAQLEPLLCSTNVDRTIELQFLPRSRMDAGACKLQLAHYGLEVQHEEDLDAQGTLRGYDLRVVPAGGQRLDEEEVRRLSLRLLRLTSPWEDWADIERFDDNRFRVNARHLAPGPYLVLVFDGGLMRSRPKLLDVPGEIDTGISAIAPVSTIPDFRDRSEAWASLVEGMTRDFEHPAWIELQKLVEITDRVPAPSFELMRTLAESPEAVSVAVLRQPSLDHQRMLLGALGQLGVMPQCVPLRAWLSGMRRLVSSLKNADAIVKAFGGVEGALAAVAKGCFGATASPVMMLELLRCIAHRASLPVPAARQNYLLWDSEMLGAVLEKKAWVETLQRHADDDNWPRATLPDEALDRAEELNLPECVPYQGDVLRAPAVAAAASFHGIPMQEAHVRRMRQLQLFDPEWFEMAHVICLTFFTKRHFDTVERYINDI